jgi:hypothetical protein
MAVAFPAIRAATGRTMQPGAYPVRRSTAPTASVTSTVRGDRVTEVKLVLDYGYIEDEQAALIWATWHATMGGFREVTLPGNAFHGVDPSVVAKIPPYLGWYMEGAPEISSVQPGLSRIRVGFAGRLLGVGGPIVVAPDPNPLAAPCAGEGDLFIVNVGSLNVRNFDVDAAGVCHVVPNFTGSAVAMYGYEPKTIAIGTTKYHFQYEESGWQLGYTGSQLSGSRAIVVAHPTLGLLLFYTGFNGGVGTATRQRIYRVSVNPANGTVQSAVAWERVLSSADGGGNTSGYYGVTGVAIDSDGATYMTVVVSSRTTASAGRLHFIKINADNTIAWNRRLYNFAFLNLNSKIMLREAEVVVWMNETITRFSKATGELVDPFAYRPTVPSGVGYFLRDSDIDDEGNIYAHIFTSTSTASRRIQIIKLGETLNVIWSKEVPIRGGLPLSAGSDGADRGVCWDAARSRLLLIDYYLVTGTAGNLPAVTTLSKGGVVGESWGILPGGKGWTNATQFASRTGQSYGNNMLSAGLQDVLVSFPKSLSLQGSANTYNNLNALGIDVNFGSMPAATASDVTISMVAISRTSVVDPGGGFTLVSPTVTTTSRAVLQMNDRFYQASN